MGTKKTAVFGIFTDRSAVEEVVAAFKDEGFRANDISVLFPEGGSTKEFAHEKHTKAPEGAVAGAGTGAMLGGTLGWLVGVGALAIPGLGPLIAAGPIMAALAGAGAGGALGGVTGALIGMGIPEYEAKRYEGVLKTGGILVSVHSDDAAWTKKGKEVMARCGGEEIDSAGEESAYVKTDDRGNALADGRHATPVSSPRTRSVDRTGRR